MSPIPQSLKASGPSWRAIGLRCAARTFLVCCVISVPGSFPALAQDDEPRSFGGPISPDDWQIDEWRRFSLRYTQSMKVERLGNEDRENLTRGVEYYLYSMTMPEPPEPIIEQRRRLMTNLRSPFTSDAARQFLLEEIVRISVELLDQPPGPRLNLMILLASLPTNATPSPPLPYVPANEILLTVINDPAQLVECKIWAAIGLGRISRDGNPTITLKSRIAMDLVQALESPEARTDPTAQNGAEWWYRMRLLEALGDNGIPVNVNQEPVVIDAMMQIIVDPDEHWMIRSTAARTCTQLKWDAGTNVALINFCICKLGHEMAQVYNQERARNAAEASYWRRCFFNIYLSYRPLTAAQRQRGWGLLQQAGARLADVQAAYQVLLPVTNGVTRDVEAQSIPQPAVDALGDWLGNNQPTDWKVTPSSEKLNVRTSPEGGAETSLTPGPGEGPAAQGTEIGPSGS